MSTTLQTIPDGATIHVRDGDRIAAIGGKLYLIRGDDPEGLARELAAGQQTARMPYSLALARAYRAPPGSF